MTSQGPRPPLLPGRVSARKDRARCVDIPWAFAANLLESRPQGHPMRKTIVTIIVLGLVALAHMAWPFYDLHRFIGAIERADVAKVRRSVDFNAVRQALAQQIVAAYFRKTGAKLGPLVQSMAASAAVSI